MAEETQSQDHTYKFNVTMSCGGCSGAVDRVLKKLDGTSGRRERVSRVPAPRCLGTEHTAR